MRANWEKPCQWNADDTDWLKPRRRKKRIFHNINLQKCAKSAC
jgi:hypothetical protein